MAEMGINVTRNDETKFTVIKALTARGDKLMICAVRNHTAILLLPCHFVFSSSFVIVSTHIPLLFILMLFYLHF